MVSCLYHLLILQVCLLGRRKKSEDLPEEQTSKQNADQQSGSDPPVKRKRKKKEQTSSLSPSGKSIKSTNGNTFKSSSTDSKRSLGHENGRLIDDDRRADSHFNKDESRLMMDLFDQDLMDLEASLKDFDISNIQNPFNKADSPKLKIKSSPTLRLGGEEAILDGALRRIEAGDIDLNSLFEDEPFQDPKSDPLLVGGWQTIVSANNLFLISFRAECRRRVYT